MTSPRETRIKAVPAKKKAPESFPIWVGQKNHKAVIEALFALPGLTLIFSLVNLFGRQHIPQFSLHLDTVTTAVLFTQFAILALMYFFIPAVPGLKQPADDIHGSHHGETERLAARGNQFASLWSYAWLCWALLYFGLGMSALAKSFFPAVHLWFVAPATNLLNNVQTVFFIMCFRELRYPTHNRRSPLAAAIVAAVILAVCETFFLIPGVPYREHFGVALSKVIGWASGCVGGAAIALLVGRLETKLIDAPVVMTVIFYFYASIQGAFPFLVQDNHLALVFTSLAFIFKLCLFYFMAWLLESGVLLFYFSKMLELDDKTPRERRSFLEREVVAAGPSPR